MKKDNLHEYLTSKQFKIDFRKQVEKDTWDKDLPMIYMDEDGWLVNHWKDGKIERIKQIRNEK